MIEEKPRVPNSPSYTKAELKEFDRLTQRTVSLDQVERITARLALTKFIEQHSKEKCDAMWSEIMKREGRK